VSQSHKVAETLLDSLATATGTSQCGRPIPKGYAAVDASTLSGSSAVANNTNEGDGATAPARTRGQPPRRIDETTAGNPSTGEMPIRSSPQLAVNTFAVKAGMRMVMYMLRSNDGLRRHAMESAAEILGELPAFAFAGDLDGLQTSSLDEIEKMLLGMADVDGDGGDMGGDAHAGVGHGGSSDSESQIALTALVELAVVRGSLRPLLRIVETILKPHRTLIITPPMFDRLCQTNLTNLPPALRQSCFPGTEGLHDNEAHAALYEATVLGFKDGGTTGIFGAMMVLTPMRQLADLANSNAAAAKTAADPPNAPHLPHSCFDPSLDTFVALGRIMTFALWSIEKVMFDDWSDDLGPRLRPYDVAMVESSGQLALSVASLTLVNLRASPRGAKRSVEDREKEAETLQPLATALAKLSTIQTMEGAWSFQELAGTYAKTALAEGAARFFPSVAKRASLAALEMKLLSAHVAFAHGAAVAAGIDGCNPNAPLDLAHVILKERVGSKLGLACLYLEDSASTRSLLALTMTLVSKYDASSSPPESKPEMDDEQAVTSSCSLHEGWHPTSEACVLLHEVLSVVESSAQSMVEMAACSAGVFNRVFTGGSKPEGVQGSGLRMRNEEEEEEDEEEAIGCPNKLYVAPKLECHGADRLLSEMTPLADYSWRWVKPRSGRQGLHVSPDGKTATGTFSTRTDFSTAVGSAPFTGLATL